MPKFTSPEGIVFSSKIEYYRTIEDQGSKGAAEFLTYINRKYNLIEKVRHRNQCKERNKKRYENDQEHRSHKIKASLERYYHNKNLRSDITKFLSVTVH